MMQTSPKDTAATAPKFGELYQEIQNKYGEKAEKPREIKKTLGKDDFLRIMITQMKNQDPTNPFKAEQMATEIAQFTTVEQLQNVNQNLTKMTNQSRPLEQMAMTQMIGKVVTIDRGRFPHLEGQADDLTFKLPKDAKSVKVTIKNEAGESLFEKEMGSQKAGDVSFNWDGIRSNTLPAKSGNYLFEISAKDSKDIEMTVNPRVQAKIIGISFEGSDPIFLVGDNKHQEKITLRNIVRIDEGVTTEAKSLAAEKPKMFMPFEKEIKPTVAQVATEAPIQAAPRIAPPPAPEEKGFPNGLNDE